MDSDLRENIVEIVSTICDLTFEININPIGALPPSQNATYHASVHILGDWNGSVTVEMSAPLAESTAQRLLNLEDQNEIDLYYVQQFMQEFVNMTGGNLKPLLGDRCVLSTPKCVPSQNFEGSVPGCKDLVTIPFVESSGGYVLVKLYVSTEDPKALIKQIAEEEGIELPEAD